MYYRKLERLANLRSDMAQFETTLQTILAARSSGASHEHALVPNIARDLIMTRMAKIERVLETLERENNTLQQILFQHEQELNRIQQSLQRLEQVNIASLSGNIKIKHLSRVECFELRNRSLDDVCAFERSKYQLASGGKVCGWDNLQLVQDNVLKFYMEKRVPSFRADQMAALSWSVVRDPERFKSLHSNAVGMKCHTVQCIDDDNIVRFHEHLMMNSNNECLTVKTIVFLSRLQTASGYLILLRSMDPTAMVVEDLSLDECLGSVLWNDHFFWLEYTSDTPELCRCTFAGLASMVGANAYARMIELMQIAVRWEAMTIGAARLLPLED
uniref:START domain-containing protein n=1 Tax=Globisporangium ultimum (strain ATCC 200006 / CBS 805.95 / DAOM BR144) TaxID=431595 RepID=K3WNQ4_GLOUD